MSCEMEFRTDIEITPVPTKEIVNQFLELWVDGQYLKELWEINGNKINTAKSREWYFYDGHQKTLIQAIKEIFEPNGYKLTGYVEMHDVFVEGDGDKWAILIDNHYSEPDWYEKPPLIPDDDLDNSENSIPLRQRIENTVPYYEKILQSIQNDIKFCEQNKEKNKEKYSKLIEIYTKSYKEHLAAIKALHEYLKTHKA